ncbi:hypothetical protein K435DRAFT_869986 [Dendrothele bispora CBS 962.96]|uniref:Uncharacterized protein n=1 Tax=Dendrothele bispora (strain CBS 962.96) TaxID=1314807 RepID=A0A4S8L7P6_DENBC|nr:hypothetical protein K435DRAFT_869986 [Dendrothele bispora CBS 962.96]
MSELPPSTVFLDGRIAVNTFNDHTPFFDAAAYASKDLHESGSARFPDRYRFLCNRLTTNSVATTTERLLFLEDMVLFMAENDEFFEELTQEIRAFIQQSTAAAAPTTVVAAPIPNDAAVENDLGPTLMPSSPAAPFMESAVAPAVQRPQSSPSTVSPMMGTYFVFSPLSVQEGQEDLENVGEASS